jgi:hypothetical protein
MRYGLLPWKNLADYCWRSKRDLDGIWDLIERQHARVGRQLGAAEVDFQVMFTRAATTVGPDGALNVAPSTRVQFRQPVPRLTQALIAAYPSCPSPGDIATIQQLGYTDIDQVAQYTQDMNRDFGVELPLPLWARLPN